MPRTKAMLTESKSNAISKTSAKPNMPKAKAIKRGHPEEKKKKKKKRKDPNAPKRGLSAYMFFANDHRETVRENNPGISFGQIGKTLGEQWRALDEKDRMPYEDKAKEDKERYESEKAAYQNKDDDDDEEEDDE